MHKIVNFDSKTPVAAVLCSSAILIAFSGDAAAQHVTGLAAPAASQFALKGYRGSPLDEGQGLVTAAAKRKVSSYEIHVSPSGNDSNPGTAAAPFRTLARAARAVKPSTTVWVAPGNYDGGFKTMVSGTAGSRIHFVSTTKWGARIVPPASSSSKVAWDNRGNYVDIVGFQVDGSAPGAGTRWTTGIYNGGSNDVIRGNWVHHVAHNIGCTSGGGSAIGVDGYYKGVNGDVIGNLVHDIGPAGCRYVQGIYMSTSGSVTNNVVYRVAEAAIHLWHDARSLVIANNTVAASSTGIIIGGGDFYHHRSGADNVHVYNNLVFDNRYGISEQGKTGKSNTYRSNLVYQNSVYDWKLNNGLNHYDSVSSHPLLLAYSRSGTPNLKPSPSSPAIGRGNPGHAPAVDFLERPRNAATGIDIGAYQQ